MIEINDEPLPDEPKRTRKRDIPPAPDQDPRTGDKTPAFARWLRQYRPEQAAKQYAGRNILTDEA